MAVVPRGGAYGRSGREGRTQGPGAKEEARIRDAVGAGRPGGWRHGQRMDICDDKVQGVAMAPGGEG